MDQFKGANPPPPPPHIEIKCTVHIITYVINFFIIEAQIIKYLAYYGETEFSKLLSKKAGLTILSVNIQYINTKFNDFESVVNRMNLTNSISVICLQECWIKETDNISMLNLTDYSLSF